MSPRQSRGIVVPGAHWLAAAKLLGWEKIDCIEVPDDPISAELWEIAENLHCCDLTNEQRDNHIRRFAELLKERRRFVPQNAEQISLDPTGRPKGVAREIAVANKLGPDLQLVARGLAR